MYRTLLVIGDNPTQAISLFDKNKTVNAYILYHYSNAKKLREQAMEFYNSFLGKAKELNLSELQIGMLNEKIQRINNMSDDEYFDMLKGDYEVDSDNNILSTSNPNGKWKLYRTASLQSISFIGKDKKEYTTLRKKDIDWETMKAKNSHIYERTWEIVINQDEAVTDEDKTILKNMNDKKDYLLSFKTKENYIKFNCSFWCFAVIKNGKWFDIDSYGIQDTDWVNHFVDRFIASEDDNTTLSLYEFIS